MIMTTSKRIISQGSGEIVYGISNRNVVQRNVWADVLEGALDEPSLAIAVSDSDQFNKLYDQLDLLECDLEDDLTPQIITEFKLALQGKSLRWKLTAVSVIGDTIFFDLRCVKHQEGQTMPLQKVDVSESSIEQIDMVTAFECIHFCLCAQRFSGLQFIVCEHTKKGKIKRQYEFKCCSLAVDKSNQTLITDENEPVLVSAKHRPYLTIIERSAKKKRINYVLNFYGLSENTDVLEIGTIEYRY